MHPRYLAYCVRNWCVALLTFSIASHVAQCYAEDLLVFAAASMKPALDEIVNTAEVKNIAEVKVSYAATSVLAKQIEAGAPATLFISADVEWMDYLEQRQKLASGSRSNLIGNRLVLVTGNDNSLQLSIAPGFDLLAALGVDGRLALAETNAVPAGRYAKAALMTLGVWDKIAARVVAAENVRAALNLVDRSEAVLAVVYHSDAVSDSKVRIVDTFPKDSHAPIIYLAAIVSRHDTSAAMQLLRYLQSPAAHKVFLQGGFTALPD